jgi:hypothetical protein
MKGHIIKLLVRISPIDFLIAAIESIGWDVAIPEGNNDDSIPGLVTGNSEYIEKILNALEKEEKEMIDGYN